MLLHTLVQVTLDSPAIGIGGEDEPLPRRTQLRQLEPQAVERFP